MDAHNSWIYSPIDNGGLQTAQYYALNAFQGEPATRPEASPTTQPVLAPRPTRNAQGKPDQYVDNGEASESDSGNDDEGRGGSGKDGRPSFSTLDWDRAYKYSAEGVAEARAKWEVEHANTVMPPPPPAAYPSKDSGVAAVKAFARNHGYMVTISHSYKDKGGECNRLVLRCELAGKYRNHHKLTPEARVRNRFSRKTDCQMKLRLQKKKFSDEWVCMIIHATHNHASIVNATPLHPSPVPELEAALYDWHTAELSKGEVVHGNTLKQRAMALFAEMPQYRGQQPPEFDREWLDQYRLRHNIPFKQHRPARPPELVDWSNAEAAAAAAAAAPRPVPLPASKEQMAFANLDDIFPDKSLLTPVRHFVKDYMSRYDASHDFDHILRVFTLSRHILHQEETHLGNALHYDSQLVLLTALLHDVGDHKYQKPGETSENQIAELLLQHGASVEMAMKIQLIAKNVSFSNEVKNPRMMKAVLDQNPELAIVQDADRLDAIGAIGIGRTFTYGGAKRAEGGMGSTLAHFEEKLERLIGMMKTDTGRRMAQQRTERLQQFRKWWEEEDNMVV